MTGVEVFVDPSCPWAWITTRWIKEVAPQRDLEATWRSYCLEIRELAWRAVDDVRGVDWHHHHELLARAALDACWRSRAGL